MDVRMPDGTIVANVPDNMTQEDLLEQYKNYQPPSENLLYGIGANITPSLAKGLGSLGQLPGKLADLVTGTAPNEQGGFARDVAGLLIPGGMQSVQSGAKKLEDIGQAAKTLGLQEKETERAKKIADTEGQVSKFGVALAETIMDPSLTSSFVFEQLPNLLGPKGGGMLAQATVKKVFKNTSETALGAAGVSGAIATGAAMQGVDIGYETYKDIYDQLISEGQSPETANIVALSRGRVATIEAGGLAYALSRLPGAREVEKALFKQTRQAIPKAGATSATRGAVTGTLGTSANEAGEEVGGQFISNVGKQEVFPATELTSGLGETGAFAVLGGATTGGVSGAINARSQANNQKRQAADAIQQAEDDRIAANAQALKDVAPDLTSPIVGTTTTTIDGVDKVKITRADGSVEIDGVMVEPPRVSSPETTPPEVFYSEQPLPQEVLDQGYKLVDQREENGQVYYAYTKEEPVAETPATNAAPPDTDGLNDGDLELLAQVTATQPAQFTDPDTGTAIIISLTKLNDPALKAGEEVVYGGKTYYIYAQIQQKDTSGQLELAPVNPEGTVLPTPAPPVAAPVTQLPLAQVNPEGTVLPTPVAKQVDAASVPKVTTPQSKRVAAEPTVRYGITDDGETGVPLTEGGKPFATRKEAEKIRSLQPQLRILPIKVKGKVTGYVLADKTQKQLAAEKVAAKRLQAIPVGGLLGDILRKGGINPVHRAELGFDTAENPVIGNRRLFAAEGKGISLSEITEGQEEESVAEGEFTGRDIAVEQALPDRIKDALRRFHSGEVDATGVDALEQRLEAEFQDFLAAELEANNATESMLDAGYTQQDLNVVGFTKASPELKAEVAALEAQMEALGLDPSEIIMEAFLAPNTTEPENYTRAKSELTKAIFQTAQQGGRGNVSQANVSSPSEGLESPTEAGLKAKQDAIDKDAADKAQADRDVAAKDKAEADRKAIAAASKKASSEYVLGRSAEEDLSGQKPIFSKTSEQSSVGNKDKVLLIAESVSADWEIVPDVVVVDNMQSAEIPQKVKDYNKQQTSGTTKNPEGFYYQGKIYLLASQLKNEADVRRVLYHEGLGHYGLRGVFGESFSPILDQLAIARRDLVQERAEAYGLDMNNRNDRRQAAEEVLATLAQTRPELGFVKRAIAAIRTWLREHGFKNLKLTNDQIINDYIIPARNFIERGTQSSSEQLNDIRYSIPPLTKAPIVPSTRTPQTNIVGTPLAGTWSAAPETTLTPYIYSYQDKQVDLRDAQREIEKTTGKIDDALNAYRKETLYYGRVADQTDLFLKRELRPLLKDMEDKKLTLEEVDKYLQALHAEERNKSIANKVNGMPDGGAGIKTADAKAYLAGLSVAKRTDLDSISQRVRSIINGTQDIEVSGGLELQSKIDGWNKTWPNYVPLFRDEIDYVNSGSGMGQGFSTGGASSKAAIGSTKPVKEIIASLADQRQKAIVRSEKARVGKALYALAIANPNPDYWLPIDPNSKTDLKKVQQMMLDAGFDPNDISQLIQNIAQELKTGTVKRVFNPITKQFDQVIKYETNTQNRYSSNVLAIRINGEDKFLFFNPSNERAKRGAAAIKNLDAEQLGKTVQVVGSITRFIAALSTQYNPIFGAINFARDVQSAALNLTTTPLRNKKAAVVSGAFAAMKGVYKELRAQRAGGQTSGYYSNLYADFVSAGGKTGFLNQFGGLDKKGTIVERELKDLTKGRLRRAGSAIGGLLSDYNDMLENSVRLSAYEQGLKIGLSKEASAELAKNLTVNFNRKGASTATLGAFYAFFNANVQGTARLYETLRGPAGKKIIAGGLLLGAFQAALLAMADFDEDEPSEFIKQKNLIIPTFDGGYLMIPMPLGFNILPNIGRIISEISFGNKKSGTRKVTDLLDAVVSSFNPLGSGNAVQIIVPTIADPIANVVINKDSFGRPISKEDRSLTPSPGYLRTRDSVNEISKGIAEFLNYVSGGTEFNKGMISPTGDDINYVVGQYLGGVSREVKRVTEFIASSDKDEPFEPYQIPIVGKFYGDVNSPAGVASKFYFNVKQMAEHENEIKGRKGQGVSEYIRDNPDARLYKTANNLENDISKLNKTKKQLIERDADDPRIRRIEDQKLRVMKQFNERVKELQ